MTLQLWSRKGSPPEPCSAAAVSCLISSFLDSMAAFSSSISSVRAATLFSSTSMQIFFRFLLFRADSRLRFFLSSVSCADSPLLFEQSIFSRSITCSWLSLLIFCRQAFFIFRAEEVAVPGVEPFCPECRGACSTVRLRQDASGSSFTSRSKSSNEQKLSSLNISNDVIVLLIHSLRCAKQSHTKTLSSTTFAWRCMSPARVSSSISLRLAWIDRTQSPSARCMSVRPSATIERVLASDSSANSASDFKKEVKLCTTIVMSWQTGVVFLQRKECSQTLALRARQLLFRYFRIQALDSKVQQCTEILPMNLSKMQATVALATTISDLGQRVGAEPVLALSPTIRKQSTVPTIMPQSSTAFCSMEVSLKQRERTQHIYSRVFAQLDLARLTRKEYSAATLSRQALDRMTDTNCSRCSKPGQPISSREQTCIAQRDRKAKTRVSCAAWGGCLLNRPTEFLQYFTKTVSTRLARPSFQQARKLTITTRDRSSQPIESSFCFNATYVSAGFELGRPNQNGGTCRAVVLQKLAPRWL